MLTGSMTLVGGTMKDLRGKRMLQIYKMRISISINGRDFYNVGKSRYYFKEEDNSLLAPVEGSLTFNELFELDTSDWFYADKTTFRKKRCVMIESEKYQSVYDKYTEDTLQSITVRNTYEVYEPSLGDLINWKPIDDVIQYLKDRGLMLNCGN